MYFFVVRITAFLSLKKSLYDSDLGSGPCASCSLLSSERILDRLSLTIFCIMRNMNIRKIGYDFIILIDLLLFLNFKKNNMKGFENDIYSHFVKTR